MRLILLKITSVILLAILLFNCTKNSAEEMEPNTATQLTPYAVNIPDYFPKMEIPADNPLTVEGISLGRQLYYDPILSNNGNSCSTCHNSAEAFSSYSANSLPHINLAWNSTYLWDGHINGTLEDIMKFEVEDFFQTDISKLNNSSYYRSEFKKVFNVDVITHKNVEYALAQFFRVMVSSNSLYDKFYQHTANFTPSQMNGFITFITEKGDCFHCHSVGLFTDNRFHNIGIDSVFTGVNAGRYNYTNNPSDLGLFKTPTLRNIELTPPYMHDGRFQTLEEVVDFYNSGVKHSATLDPIMTKGTKMFGLGLSATDKQDLVAFLKTLTDTTFTKNPMLQQP